MGDFDIGTKVTIKKTAVIGEKYNGIYLSASAARNITSNGGYVVSENPESSQVMVRIRPDGEECYYWVGDNALEEESEESIQSVRAITFVPEKVETVNHPAHYNRPGELEAIEEMIIMFGAKNAAIWCNMTAYKYRYRQGAKGDAAEDRAKATWYLKKSREIQQEYGVSIE